MFVSYTGLDLNGHTFVTCVNYALERASISTFSADKHLGPLSEWEADLREHASGCSVFLCIISNSYYYRYWCMRELDVALQHGRRIVPVRYHLSEQNFDETKFRNQHMNGRRNVDRASTVDRWCANIEQLESIQAVSKFPDEEEYLFVRRIVSIVVEGDIAL